MRFYLAEHGFEVVAMDISPAALREAHRHADEKNLKISWEQVDLEHAQLPLSQFDLVVDINYLQRSLIAKLKTALKTGGHVVFETFLLDQRTIGHPNNPDYLLAHNELLAHFHDFRILYYREGKSFEGAEASFRAGLLAQKIQ
jgi:2-polyprenyl-3-methyl-5-hydroxy-6-metoxy-1,4-benzoquinol methylase